MALFQGSQGPILGPGLVAKPVLGHRGLTCSWPQGGRRIIALLDSPQICSTSPSGERRVAFILYTCGGGGGRGGPRDGGCIADASSPHAYTLYTHVPQVGPLINVRPMGRLSFEGARPKLCLHELMRRGHGAGLCIAASLMHPWYPRLLLCFFPSVPNLITKARYPLAAKA